MDFPTQPDLQDNQTTHHPRNFLIYMVGCSSMHEGIFIRKLEFKLIFNFR